MGKRSFVSAALTIAAVAAFAGSASAATMQLDMQGWYQTAPGGGQAFRVYSGAGIVVDQGTNPFLRYDVAVRVGDSASGATRGVAGLVFDIDIPQAAAANYFLDSVNFAEAGYNNVGAPALKFVGADAYALPQPSAAPANYGGGWGMNNVGLPHGGNTAIAGKISGAGNSMGLTWSGDNAPLIAGLQSEDLLGVGLGANVGRSEDPILAGQTLGFGYDIANAGGTGDGSWVVMSGLIDTTTWAPGFYDVILTPTAGNHYRTNDATGAVIDYNQPMGGGFRASFVAGEMGGSQFRFQIIPEPASMTLLALGGLALIRRRR